MFHGQKSLLSPDPGHSPVRRCISEPGRSQQLVVFPAASSHRSSPGLPLPWWDPLPGHAAPCSVFTSHSKPTCSGSGWQA